MTLLRLLADTLKGKKHSGCPAVNFFLLLLAQKQKHCFRPNKLIIKDFSLKNLVLQFAHQSPNLMTSTNHKNQMKPVTEPKT